MKEKIYISFLQIPAKQTQEEAKLSTAENDNLWFESGIHDQSHADRCNIPGSGGRPRLHSLKLYCTRGKCTSPLFQVFIFVVPAFEAFLSGIITLAEILTQDLNATIFMLSARTKALGKLLMTRMWSLARYLHKRERNVVVCFVLFFCWFPWVVIYIKNAFLILKLPEKVIWVQAGVYFSSFFLSVYIDTGNFDI